MLKTIKARLMAACLGLMVVSVLLATLSSYRAARSTILRDLAAQLSANGQAQADRIAACRRAAADSRQAAARGHPDGNDRQPQHGRLGRDRKRRQCRAHRRGRRAGRARFPSSASSE